MISNGEVIKRNTLMDDLVAAMLGDEWWRDTKYDAIIFADAGYPSRQIPPMSHDSLISWGNIIDDMELMVELLGVMVG